MEVQSEEEFYGLRGGGGRPRVYNRRFFNEALEREFNRAKRYQRALSLILFDIDFFKRINDTFGHVAGDNVLRHMALSVKPRLRREDILARTGGEEFGILLPEIALDGARTIAEKVRRIVETAQVKHEQQNVRWTISLGVAGLKGDEATPEDLYQAADQRLYEAKQGGRNRVAG